GLGLSLVKELIERNNGKFDIESTLHQGTTIKLYFPKKQSL
ncbi:MAG: ATP-binding protein, partial [Ekhidna sp.]|nr:ATP-binding protein [Ekhidna sp.]